jgi:hypothetical protein
VSYIPDHVPESFTDIDGKEWRPAGASPNGYWLFFMTAAMEDGVGVASAFNYHPSRIAANMRLLVGDVKIVKPKRWIGGANERLELTVLDAGVEKSIEIDPETALYIAERFGLRIGPYRVTPAALA